MPQQKPREIAVRLLQQRERAPDHLEQLLDAEFARHTLPGPDRALVHELVLGITRWEATLDWLIRRKAERLPTQPVLMILLRLGLYQLFWLDRIPDHAAVNETVALAHELGFAGQSGFLNALLRGYARDREGTRQELETLKREDPALGYSHPSWLYQRWLKRWGADRGLELLRWNNTPPKRYARVNTLRTQPGKLLEAWREEDVEYDFGRWNWVEENLVFELKSHPPLAQLESFKKGWFYLQDPSTLLAVKMLAPLPRDRILDLCAAPGGKTTLIAQRIENKGEIIACDVAPERLELLRENCKRLDASCVKAVADLPGLSRQIFDRVLVDAPCSNTGVMRRRAELRWRVTPEEIARLARMQQQLLKTAADRLEPGGVLVYSTCSLEPEENRQAVDLFTQEHPEFRLISERELTPFTDRVDGAYVACFSRV